MKYTLCTSRIEILDVGTLATQRKPRAFGAEFDIPIATLELQWVYLLIILALLFRPAQTLAETLTLDMVIKESLQKNTGIYRVQREFEDRLADATEATQINNPELNADAIRSSRDSGAGAGIELTQPLKFSQVSGARLAYADALVRAAGTQQHYEILKVINETSALYTQVWLFQERKKLYESYADDADKMKKLVSAASAQGQTSSATSHLFSADAAKLRADAGAVGAELRQTRSDLARLTGRNYQLATLQRPAFSIIPADTDKLLNFSASRSTLRNVTKNRISAAEERVRVAEQDAVLPEIGPRLLYSRSPDGGEKSYGFGVGLRIPLWDQNNAERKRAHAELRQAKSEADIFAGLPPKDLISELRQSAVALQERADGYFQNILPAYRQSYELTRKMFRQGQANALEVWQVREKLLTSENEALDAVAQAVNARGTLEMELGGKLEEIQ